MDIQLTVSQLGSQSGYVIFNIYDPTALSTVIDSQYVALPISNTAVVDFIGLDDMTYVVKTFLSQDTNWQDGIQIGSDFYAYPGSTTTSAIRDDLWLIADTTPNFASGQLAYADTSLADWTYDIECRGVGTLSPAAGTGDYNLLAGGGFMLKNRGVIQPGEIFILHFQPNVTSNGGGSSTGGKNAKGNIFSDFITITDDVTLDATSMGKINLIQGNNPLITITLPEVDTVPDNQMILFLSDGGSHITATITASAGFMWLKENRSSLYLSQGESIQIFKNGSSWYVAQSNGNFKTVGELVEGYSLNGLNCILCNGNVLFRAWYPRLWEYIQNKIDPALLVSEEDWAFYETITGSSGDVFIYPNVGKFSTGDGSTTFRIPLLMKAKDEAGNIIHGGYLRGAGIPIGPIAGISSDLTIGKNEMDQVGNFFSNIQGIKSITIPTVGPYSGIWLGTAGPFSGEIAQNVENVPFTGQSYTGSEYINNGDTHPAGTGIYRLMRF